MTYINHNQLKLSYKGERDWIEQIGGPVCVRDSNGNFHNMFFIPPQMYYIDIPPSGGLLKTHFHKADAKPTGTEGVDFVRETLGGFCVDLFQNSHPLADAMICAVDSKVDNKQFTCQRLAYDSDTNWGSPKAAVHFLTGGSKNECKEVATFNTTTGELTFATTFTNVTVGDMILISTKGWADSSVTTQPAVGTTISRSKAFRSPWCYMDLADAKTVCAARGSGFHLLMNHEWWDIAVWCILNGYVPLGNNDGSLGPSIPPRDYEVNSVEFLIDPIARQQNNTYNRSLTGTGGPRTGHNLSLSGIFDLNGNIWEWVDGLFLNNGIIYVSRKPNAVYPTDYINTGLAIGNGGIVVSGQTIKSIRKENILLKHGIPHESAVNSSEYNYDCIYYDVTNIRGALRGGCWYNHTGAGIFALTLNTASSGRYNNFGFRSSLVL